MSIDNETNRPDVSGPYPAQVEERLRGECAQIVARYPEARSALLPMLHLIQAEDSFVSPRGIGLCADVLGLSRAEVSAVATFYSQYKRHPNGCFTVGVCTNTLCAVMGGDAIFDTLSERLGIGHDETTADGRITLERLECNAACDYAPVVMVNWEFFDNQTPESATRVVDRIAAGEPVVPTRGAAQVQDFRATSRVLAGFEDGLVDEGETAGEATLAGLALAREKGWRAPAFDGEASAEQEHADPGVPTDVAAGEQAGEDAVGKEQSSSDQPEASPAKDSGERPDAPTSQRPEAGASDGERLEEKDS